MKNKIFKLITVLSIIMFITYFYLPILSKAETLGEQQQKVQEQKEEAKQELKYVQDELSESVVQIQELDDSIEKSEEELSKLESQLSELQKKIDDIQIEIEKKEKEYVENKQISEERLAMMYEMGELGYLDLLMQSTSIVEFISNYYDLQEILNSDIELLEGIEDEKNTIEKSKKELEEEKANLKLLKTKQQQTYVIMQNNKVLKENYINQLTKEEIELQQKIQDYKNEEQRIQNLIDFAAGLGYEGEFTGGLMVWPVAKKGTYITSDYGIREHPIQGVIKQHTGIDIGNAGYGAPIVAALDGVVSYAGELGGYGNCVMINHGNGITTLYGHGQTILTKVGTQVKQGDLIMEVGSTGNSTGPHLHFEVRINGSCVDPKPYLKIN